MYPKSSLQKTKKDSKQTLEGTVEPIIAIAGVVAKNSASTQYRGIPLIKVPEDGQKLVDLIKNHLPQSKPSQKAAD